MRLATPCFLGLASVLSVPALAWNPRTLSTPYLQSHLAQALGIEPQRVVAVRGYALTKAGSTRGFALGTYRGRERKDTFAALVAYHACGSDLCLGAALRLSGKATGLGALSLVDLDAKRTALSTSHAGWYGSDVPEPARKASWPVLLVAVERSTPGEPGAKRQDAVLVSLRRPAHPEILLVLETLQRLPAGDRGSGGIPPRHVGRRVEGLVFTRQGERREIVVTERLIDAPYSKSSRSPSTSRRFVLTGDRFVEVIRSAKDTNRGR